MRYWMVRAGEGGKYFGEFISHDVIALGWESFKRDLAKLSNKSEFATIYRKQNPKESKQQRSVIFGQIWNFVHIMQKGDVVLTPNPLTRTVYIGRIKNQYYYQKKHLGLMKYAHRRKVDWEKKFRGKHFPRTCVIA